MGLGEGAKRGVRRRGETEEKECREGVEGRLERRCEGNRKKERVANGRRRGGTGIRQG